MSYKKFDSSKIYRNNNPFPDTRAVTIVNNTYIREVTGEYSLVPEVRTAVNVGLLKKLFEHYRNNKNDEGKYKPSHLIILADYGQGKTLALRRMQEEIFSNSYDVLISYSIGNNATDILQEKNKFIKDLIKTLSNALMQLVNTKYPTFKDNLETVPAEDNLQNLLLIYDDFFYKIDTRVFIIIDEIDKILDPRDLSTDPAMQKSFLEEIKMIADACSKSISLWIAGTPNCKAIISNLGRDYLQRFQPPIMSTFNKDDTLEYIDSKCIQKVHYKGYIPFTNEVKLAIDKYADSNIRNIDFLCKELWNIASDNHIRIDKKEWKKYILSKLDEPIKEIFGNSITRAQIEVIALLIVNEKIGLSTLHKNKSRKIKEEIDELINRNECLIKINRSYRLDSETKDSIKRAILGG